MGDTQLSCNTNSSAITHSTPVKLNAVLLHKWLSCDTHGSVLPNDIHVPVTQKNSPVTQKSIVELQYMSWHTNSYPDKTVAILKHK